MEHQGETLEKLVESLSGFEMQKDEDTEVSTLVIESTANLDCRLPRLPPLRSSCLFTQAKTRIHSRVLKEKARKCKHPKVWYLGTRPHV